MDIFDIFWAFYLNHLSPLWGYFSVIDKHLIDENLSNMITMSSSNNLVIRNYSSGNIFQDQMKSKVVSEI